MNGKTFTLNADVEEYCQFVQELMGNNKKYKELAFSAFNEYQTRLNTKTAADNVIKLLQEL